jgi:hypothetical protein
MEEAVRRSKRARRARHMRAKLEAEARRLAQEAHDLAYAALVFERDHLDRYEREAIDCARTLLHQAGRALESLASSLRRPGGGRDARRHLCLAR